MQNVGIGWNDFITEAKLRIDTIPNAKIVDIGYRAGMLRITFEALDNNIQYMLDLYTLDIERRSSKICEVCGANGSRRKDLPDQTCLCMTHYALLLSNLDDKERL